MKDPVDLRAIEEVVIDRLARDGSQLQIEREATLKPGERRRIPQHSVAFARNQQRDRDIGVVLAQLYRCSAIVEHAALMLTESVERFIDRGRKAVRDSVGLITIEFDWLVRARDAVAFIQQRLSAECADSEIA